MALLGERSSRLVELELAALIVLGLCALGCAAGPHTRRLPASVFQAARLEARGAVPFPPGAGDEGAALVAQALHDAGLRFGTDGSVRALWGYLRLSHEVISAERARPGDILFFDTRGAGSEPECADHAGIVESVAADGQITFLEARGRQRRHSFVNPARPTERRNAAGEIANSFLRAKAMSDPPGSRYFAGEMLCGVARVTHR